jgi:hypothetical protein
MLGILITSCTRIWGLGPFWRNPYTQYGEFLKDDFIRSEVFTVNLVTKDSESMHQHVAHMVNMTGHARTHCP